MPVAKDFRTWVRCPPPPPIRGAALGTRSHRASGAVSCSGNASLEQVDGGDALPGGSRSLDVVTRAGSLEYRTTARWSLVGEIIGTLGAVHARDMSVLRGGVVYAISHRIRVDSAIGAGLTRGSPDVLFTVGVTIGLF